MDWLSETTLRIARATGLDPADLLVGAQDAQALLDVAGFAAHDSGDRTNAPLLCHVLGRAVARGASLDAALHAARDGGAHDRGAHDGGAPGGAHA